MIKIKVNVSLFWRWLFSPELYRTLFIEYCIVLTLVLKVHIFPVKSEDLADYLLHG